MENYLKTGIGRFRLVGTLEGISFLLLVFVAMPLKYYAGQPGMVKIVGMIHGLLFVLYALQTFQMREEYNWRFNKVLLAIIAAVLPFGTFYFNRKWLNKDVK